MSIEKQELLKSIETLPEELASKVIDYMEYVKFMYITLEYETSFWMIS